MFAIASQGIQKMGKAQMATDEHTRQQREELDRRFHEREEKRKSLEEEERRVAEEAERAEQELMQRYRLKPSPSNDDHPSP